MRCWTHAPFVIFEGEEFLQVTGPVGAPMSDVDVTSLSTQGSSVPVSTEQKPSLLLLS